MLTELGPIDNLGRNLYRLAVESFLKLQTRSSWGPLPSGFERSFLAEVIRFLNEGLVPICRQGRQTRDFILEVRVTKVQWFRNGSELFFIKFGELASPPAQPLLFKNEKGKSTSQLVVALKEKDDKESLHFDVQIVSREELEKEHIPEERPSEGRKEAAAGRSFVTGQAIGRQYESPREESLEWSEYHRLVDVIKFLYQASAGQPGHTTRRRFREQYLSRTGQSSLNDLTVELIQQANDYAEGLLTEANHPGTKFYRAQIMLSHPSTTGRGPALYYAHFNPSVPQGEALFFLRHENNLQARRLAEVLRLGEVESGHVVTLLRKLGESALQAAEQVGSPLLLIRAAVWVICKALSEQRAQPLKWTSKEELDAFLGHHQVGAETSHAKDRGILREYYVELSSLASALEELLACARIEGAPLQAEVWRFFFLCLYYGGLHHSSIDQLRRRGSQLVEEQSDENRLQFREWLSFFFCDPDLINEEQVPLRESIYRAKYHQVLFEQDQNFFNNVAQYVASCPAGASRSELSAHLLRAGSQAVYSSQLAAKDSVLLYQKDEVGSATLVRNASIPMIIARQSVEEAFRPNNRKDAEYLLMGALEKPSGIGGTSNPLLLCPLVSKGQVLGVQFISFFGPSGGFTDDNLLAVEAHCFNVASILQNYKERLFLQTIRSDHGDSMKERAEFLLEVLPELQILFNLRGIGARRARSGPARLDEDSVRKSILSSYEEIFTLHFSEHLEGSDNHAPFREAGELDLERWSPVLQASEFGTILHIWNPAAGVVSPASYREIISLWFDRSADIIQENLLEISELIREVINPLERRSAAVAAKSVGTLVSLFSAALDGTKDRHFDSARRDRIVERLRTLPAEKANSVGIEIEKMSIAGRTAEDLLQRTEVLLDNLG